MDAYEQAMYGMAPSYELTEEEKKRLKMQQMIATGAALMAGRGNFVNNLGQAMLVGQNQGSEGMQDLRRNKLADAEIQYRNAQIANQQRTFEAAQAKAAAEQMAAQQQAALTGNVQTALRQGAAEQMPFGSFTNDPAVNRQVEQMSPEDMQRAAMLQAATMAIGNKDLHAQTLGTVKEFLTQYGLDPKVNAQGQMIAFNQWGQGKPTGQNAAPKISWRTMGDRDEAWNEYDLTKPAATVKQGRSPDNVASVGEAAASRMERKRQFDEGLVEAPGTALFPGYGPGNVMAPRKNLPKGAFAAKSERSDRAVLDKPMTRAQWADDTRADWTAKYPLEFGQRPKGAPTLDEYRQQYPFEGKSDAAVTAPAPAKKIVRTGVNKKTGKRVVQYEDGTTEELQ